MYRKSASCTHVSALLHALVSLTAPQFQLQPSELESQDVLHSCDEETVPVTSRPCQWKAPKKRKESTMAMSEVSFIKHEYGREKKRTVEPLEDFDPRPVEFRGSASEHLPDLLDKIRGEQLCISLLFDKSFCYWDNSTTAPSNPTPPSAAALRITVDAFKASLAVSEESIRKIERDTRQQRKSTVWHSVRRFRLTASMFGNVLRRKPNTPPDSLVLSILQPKQFESAATDWGIQQESLAIHQYARYQWSHGHPDLSVAPCGFHISPEHPFLGATPDGAVFDASHAEEPFGFLEVKCPYAQRNVTPAEACSTPGFCCTLQVNPDGTTQLFLRTNHIYYAQVQGQMAVGNRPWCDFVIYTSKGISVQRIQFDKVYWEKTLLPKLTEFYDNCLGPEIVSPVHVLGLPIRNLSK